MRIIFRDGIAQLRELIIIIIIISVRKAPTARAYYSNSSLISFFHRCSGASRSLLISVKKNIIAAGFQIRLNTNPTEHKKLRIGK